MEIKIREPTAKNTCKCMDCYYFNRMGDKNDIPKGWCTNMRRTMIGNTWCFQWTSRETRSRI